MPKFRSKPSVITAEQFRVDRKPWPHNVSADADGHVVWNELHRSFIRLKDGDWVRVDHPNDNYPIDEATFATTYEPVQEEVV